MLQFWREPVIGMLTEDVRQSSCRWIGRSFLDHELSPKAFLRIWHYIYLASQLQATCNHPSPRTPHPASYPPRCLRKATRQLLQQSIWITKEFLHKATWVVKSSQSIVCAKVFSPRMNTGFYCTGRMVLCRWAVCWCQRCCPSGVMVWAGIYDGQGAQVHFIYGSLNSQRYGNKIWGQCHPVNPRPSPARPHVLRIYTQFLETKNKPVFSWLVCLLNMSLMFGML